MADAARFPHVAVPFAVAGAAAGWALSGLAQHTDLARATSMTRPLTALAAGLVSALAGVLVRHACIEARYSFQDANDPPDPTSRASSDTWTRHVWPVLLAGGTAGAAFAATLRADSFDVTSVAAGLGAALLLTPAFAWVLSAARTSQRGRPGSSVAASDRRSVWTVTFATVAAVTLAALPEWPAPRTEGLHGPAVSLALLAAASAAIAALVARDWMALRRTRALFAGDLARQDTAAPHVDDAELRRLDLGLGDDVHAEIARAGAVYRAPHRTLTLVTGAPDAAIGALRRGVRRGLFALALCGAVAGAHAAATSDRASLHYSAFACARGNGLACSTVARQMADSPIAQDSIEHAILYFEAGCTRADGASCLSLSWLYRGNGGVDKDVALAVIYEYRAAQRGICPPGTRLVKDAENTCVPEANSPSP